MYQKIVLVGNLGADPEMRYTPAGLAYARFPVAVNRKWHDAEGQLQEETTWYRVVVWGRQAETCHQYLAKGRKVLVEGERLQATAYLGRDKQPAASLELTARSVHFLDSARPAGNGHAGEQAELAFEEELPF
jgi:single-strand DNA-binding protein